MNQIQIHGLTAILLFLLTIAAVRTERRRLINGFLLELGIYHLVITGLYAIPNQTVMLAVGRVFVVAILFVLVMTGLFLLADGFLVIRREGRSFAHALPVLWGIIMLAGAYVWYEDCFLTMSGSAVQVVFRTFLMKLVLYIPMALLGVRLYSWIYKHLKKPADVPYIVVLGCKIRKDGSVTPLLKGRLDAAIQWYEKGGRKAKIIVSGGQGRDEVTSEAAAMKRYLLEKGIPENRIFTEDRSKNTRENLLFSKEIMVQDGGVPRFLIATSSYHVMRSVILARDLHLDAQGVGGKTALYYAPAACLREYVALIFEHKIVLLAYVAYVIASTLINTGML